MIIGCSGSGKSTLAVKLGEKTNIPIIHLDQHYWQPNWVETPKKEWKEIVNNLVKEDSWIMDGNYGSTMDLRLNRADTIIYLDISTIKCLWRITKRILKYHGQVRPDMTDQCVERFDLQFYHYVLTYNLTRRKNLLKKLNQYRNQADIHIFRDNAAIQMFVEHL